MTLKELSDELGKNSRSLANTLRQVGLADRLLEDSETLTTEQENRLRSSYAPKVKDITSTSDEEVANNKTDDDSTTERYKMVPAENNEDVKCLNSNEIRSIASTLDISEGRVLNILENNTYGSFNPLTDYITNEVKKTIIHDFRYISTNYQQETEISSIDRRKILGLDIMEKPQYDIQQINSMDDVNDALTNECIVEGIITDINNGGYSLKLSGKLEQEFFCPNSLGPTWINEEARNELIGKKWLLILMYNPKPKDTKDIIASAKLDQKNYDGILIDNGYYNALICGVNEGGANVLVEGQIPMFVPKSKFCWEAGHDSEFKTGVWLPVKILNNNKGRIASFRDATFDQWLMVKNILQENTVHLASIIKKEQKFIRVCIENYEGILQASEISWTEYVSNCEDYDLQDPIQVLVIGYDDKNRRVSVSYKKVKQADPWENIEGHIPFNTSLCAKIVKVMNSGVQLKVGVGDYTFAGYMSFRDVDWCTYIDKDSFLHAHAVGDSIEIAVTRANKDRRLLTCSLKALKDNPWEKLSGKTSVDGKVNNIYKDYADVRIEGGIECLCHEVLDPKFKGKTLTFKILQLNVISQQLVISYRKQEIENLNILAVGEMFKEYRNLLDSDKTLSILSYDNGDESVIRSFRVKDVSSTGRVIARYNGDDGEFENGILLPGSVTVMGHPVNVIFARQIIKQYIHPGQNIDFQVTHSYDGLDYAVLAIDAKDLTDLENIDTSDMTSLISDEGVEATVLSNLCTERNLFVQWNGYFGYIPRTLLDDGKELPKTLRVKAVVGPVHPWQMIRFIPVDKEEEEENILEQQVEEEVAKGLDADLYDCYTEISRYDAFNKKIPDYYPYALQLRYDPKKFENLAISLNDDPMSFSSQTFFLDCYKIEEGYILSIFNNEISISAFCRENEGGDYINITKYNQDVSSSTDIEKLYKKPLRISGKNLQIIPQNASAQPPSMQDVDIVMTFIKYNREVLPRLQRLCRDGQTKRCENYLTLRELLKMDLEREVKLCKKEVMINTEIKEDAGSLGSIGLTFEADPNEIGLIMSKDDSEEGFQVIIKPNNDEPFSQHDMLWPSGKLRKLDLLDSHRWIIELYQNQNYDIDALKKGIRIMRFPNIRHLKKQIKAIDNYVYERNGLDIFSKIIRQKLKPVQIPSVEEIEANHNFDMSDPNDSQANALKMALGGSEISLIQGPPGTGKSTVIVDIIRNLVKGQKKVLVCTQSIAPVEELYYKLSGRRDRQSVGKPVMVDRHPLRCAYLRDDESMELSGSVEDLRSAVKDMALFVKNLNDVNSSTDGSSDANINKPEERLNKGHEDECKLVRCKFQNDIMPQCDDVLNILDEYQNALDKKDVVEFYAGHQTLNLEAVDVVFGTCIGVGVNRQLKDLHFDTLIIDEAGKANYAESLVPMMMANEYILVGDDKQLPPYTNSELVKELAERRLNERYKENEEEDKDESNLLNSEIANIMEDVDTSLFGDLEPRLPESNKIMLSRQFRMHPIIGDFISELFYDGKVVSVPKPEDRTLNIKGLENPIEFIDTSGMGREARESRLGTSLYNDGEIQAIEEELLPMLEEALYAGKSVGILSPYSAQVMRMRERFPKLKDHIFTIDSIQGEEYDIVVFSFVRSTPHGSLNFVDDLRRLNVSFSRAKCNLIMVGNLNTLRNESLHKVDKEAVMAVYNEIQNEKIKCIAHRGAMQMLYEDFPPESHSLIYDLDDLYHEFENCKFVGNGKFTCSYKNKRLKLYNPVLEYVQKTELPENLRAWLLGYKDRQALTIIGNMGFWMTKQETLCNFEFTASVNSVDMPKIVLKLNDGSYISLDIPETKVLKQGIKVKVRVSNYRYFTIKSLDNE